MEKLNGEFLTEKLVDIKADLKEIMKMDIEWGRTNSYEDTEFEFKGICGDYTLEVQFPMQFNFKLKKGEINKASFLKNLIYVNKSIVRMQKLSDSEAIELAKNILENLNKKIGRFNKSLTL